MDEQAEQTAETEEAASPVKELCLSAGFAVAAACIAACGSFKGLAPMYSWGLVGFGVIVALVAYAFAKQAASKLHHTIRDPLKLGSVVALIAVIIIASQIPESPPYSTLVWYLAFALFAVMCGLFPKKEGF